MSASEEDDDCFVPYMYIGHDGCVRHHILAQNTAVTPAHTNTNTNTNTSTNANTNTNTNTSPHAQSGVRTTGMDAYSHSSLPTAHRYFKCAAGRGVLLRLDTTLVSVVGGTNSPNKRSGSGSRSQDGNRAVKLGAVNPTSLYVGSKTAPCCCCPRCSPRPCIAVVSGAGMWNTDSPVVRVSKSSRKADGNVMMGQKKRTETQAHSQRRREKIPQTKWLYQHQLLPYRQIQHPYRQNRLQGYGRPY